MFFLAPLISFLLRFLGTAEVQGIVLLLLQKLAAMTDSPVDDYLVEEMRKKLLGNVTSTLQPTNHDTASQTGAETVAQ